MITPELKLKIAERLPWMINVREARESGTFLWERFNDIPKDRRNQAINHREWRDIKKQYDYPPVLTFSHYGFRSTEAFLIKCGRQLNVGSIVENYVGRDEEQTYTFWKYDFFWNHYVERENYIDASEVPTPEAIIEEYKRQYALKGVAINKNIVLAG